eukprot:714786-Amphidinium_carterae.1
MVGCAVHALASTATMAGGHPIGRGSSGLGLQLACTLCMLAAEVGPSVAWHSRGDAAIWQLVVNLSFAGSSSCVKTCMPVGRSRCSLMAALCKWTLSAHRLPFVLELVQGRHQHMPQKLLEDQIRQCLLHRLQQVLLNRQLATLQFLHGFVDFLDPGQDCCMQHKLTTPKSRAKCL